MTLNCLSGSGSIEDLLIMGGGGLALGGNQLIDHYSNLSKVIYGFQLEHSYQGRLGMCSIVPDSATSWNVAHQAPLSMAFSRQEY